MSTSEEQTIAEKEAVLRVRLQWIGILILAAGLLSAAVIYRSASADERSGAIGYDLAGGKSYAIMPGDSKSYQYEMERIGGKSSVFAAEIDDWFAGLWHGKRLADTVAVLSVTAFLGCFFLAYLLGLPLPPDESSGGKAS